MKVPDDVMSWARETTENTTMVDSSGQKWWRGKIEHDVVPAEGTTGHRLYAAARAVAEESNNDRIIFDRIELKRVND